MATLHNFSRSLEPIKDFDDDGLSDFSLGSEVVPYCGNPSNWSSSGVILTAFIDYYCSVCEKNPEKQEKLFQLICKELQKVNVLKTIKLSDPFRRQTRDGFTQFLQAAKLSISQDLAVAPTSSINRQSLLPFFSRQIQPLVPQPSINFIESFNQSSKLLNEFENITPIEGAEGASGKVFTAVKKSDGVQYAVKKIKIENHLDVIQREVKILARLSHPNIVRYYDSWEGLEFVPPDSESEDDLDGYTPPVQRKCRKQSPVSVIKPTHVLYIQMELCTGTLKDWLWERTARGINYDESYQIAKQILKGVDFIHSESYFHRDLKPLNIFLSKNSANDVPNIKIGDFGLARNISGSNINTEGTQEVHFTADVGTPHYGAPEQLNGTVYSEKTDLFSVGLILHELFYLFGTDMERMQVFKRLRENEEICEEFAKSRPFEALWIRRLTAKNPNNRPSAAEVLEDLRKNKSSLASSAEVLKTCIVSQDYELQDLRRRLDEKDRLLQEKEGLLLQKDHQISDLIASKNAAMKRLFELETLLKQAELDGR